MKLKDATLEQLKDHFLRMEETKKKNVNGMIMVINAYYISWVVFWVIIFIFLILF